MNDISPVENDPLDQIGSQEKPTQDSLKKIFDLVTQLAKKSQIKWQFTPEQGLALIMDTNVVPIVINGKSTSLIKYGPATRTMDKFLPSYEIIVPEIISEPNKHYAIHRRSYCLYDDGEEVDESKRFRLEAYDDIDLPHDLTQGKRKGPGLLNRWYSGEFSHISDQKKEMFPVSQDEIGAFLKDLQTAK